MIEGVRNRMVVLREVPKVTKTVTRKHGGMPNWGFLGVGIKDRRPVLYWPYWSDIDGERFLTRFIALRTPLVSMDVTRIHKDDSSRAFPHDHSRSFVSWVFGGYHEWVHYNPSDLAQRRFRRHRRFSMHLLRYTQAHSITWASPKLVTVTFLGPRKQASNYWTKLGKQTIGMGIDQKK